MKSLKSLLIFTLSTLWFTSNAQLSGDYLGQEVFRHGSIINYTRQLDGVQTTQRGNESVSNVIYNIQYETDGIYSRIDFSLIPLVIFNQDQNLYWSYNLTLGAFLNESPLEFGVVSMYYGLGVDFDLSTFVFDDGAGTRQSFESGTIGLNLRADLEILEFIQIRNSLTRGWWRPDNANRWDFRSTIGVEVIDGLYLTVAPNYLFVSNDKEGDAGMITEQSSQFYVAYGIGTEFNF